MKRFAMFAASAIAAALLVSPASADHACDPTVVDGAGIVYVVVDDLDNEHGGIWIYLESNGEAGLQRGDDSCTDSEYPDTIIY
ncbi:MAG TPA: hypothetical protein VGB64_02960 [Actinomycetota bacterium]